LQASLHLKERQWVTPVRLFLVLQELRKERCFCLGRHVHGVAAHGRLASSPQCCR